MRANRHAFTLIELLVVITIIMVLVALIYAAASGVVRMALETQCQNHLNELGKITVAYCQMHDGRFPPPGDSNVMPSDYTSSWAVGGTSSTSNRGTWTVNNGIFYRDKLIGDPSVLWCPVHFEEYNMYRPNPTNIFWKTGNPNTDHKYPNRSWTSYMMNGWVYYNPSNSSSRTGRKESRLSSEFTANHFLFIEENERISAFYDTMMDDLAADKIADRHEGYGFIACMDGHVIKMITTDFDATKSDEEKKKYWTPR
ncbi:MAG TPA: prepilin-type N-terminal cleavage/methylation domain-containing protein [Phycisphaerae bacterium]|nr:prepilin-type N-terminal cleavage/methylation domain-containing protein [Phycisphaerae bacterium]